MNLTAEQVMIIGFVATVLVAGFRLALDYFKKSHVKIDKRWMVTIVYIVALALTFVFAPAAFPTFPAFNGADVLAQDALMGVTKWIIDILVLALAQFGFATFIYKILIEKIEEQLGKRLME